MLDTVQGLKKCISLNHLVCFVVIKSLHEYLKIELQIVFMGSLCWIVSDSWSEFVHSCLCPAGVSFHGKQDKSARTLGTDVSVTV